MGTFLKYVFYLALLIIVYLVAKGVFEGNITEDSTVAQVATDVQVGAQNMADEAVQEAKELDGKMNNAMQKDVNIMKNNSEN